MDTLFVLIQQVKESRYAHITAMPNNCATFEDYLNFIKYKPLHWDIENNKRLKKISKYERWVEKSFEGIVNDVNVTSQAALDTFIFMSGIDFNEYAKLKLTEEQLELCYKRVFDYIDLNDYKGDEDEQIVRTYVNYLIRMISADRKDMLDDNIIKRIEKVKK